MGFQAILADGSVIAPAVDVLDGLLKPSQANAKYKGVTGMCPHCQELRDAQAGTDNLQVQQALSVADLSVNFKRAYLDGERMVRVMHFAHRAGFLSSPGACLLCRDNQLAHHAAAVKVIGRWAERHWPGCTVKAEMQIKIPGAPPVQFRPDVSVIDATGNRVACIEYQRSKESFEAFKARDELRCSEFGEVLWFFRTGTYGSSLDHRDYLADRSRRFSRRSRIQRLASCNTNQACGLFGVRRLVEITRWKPAPSRRCCVPLTRRTALAAAIGCGSTLRWTWDWFPSRRLLRKRSPAAMLTVRFSPSPIAFELPLRRFLSGITASSTMTATANHCGSRQLIKSGLSIRNHKDLFCPLPRSSGPFALLGADAWTLTSTKPSAFCRCLVRTERHGFAPSGLATGPCPKASPGHSVEPSPLLPGRRRAG